jgi:hypothetical protein
MSHKHIIEFSNSSETLDGKKQLHIIGVEQYMNVIENLRYSVEKPDETPWSKMTLQTPDVTLISLETGSPNLIF